MSQILYIMKKRISTRVFLAGLACFLSLPLQAQTTNIWNFNYTGSIVDWTVPSTGVFHITAYGAQGGGNGWYGNSGGLGAIMGGVFQLQAGSELKLLVGEQGSFTNVFMGGGGGGGSFVVGSNNTPLVVSGAGAGVAWGTVYMPGPYGQYTDQSYFSPNANTNTSGGSVGFSHDTSTNVIMTYGGTNGNGGNVTTSGYGSGDNQGAAGAGFYGDGSSVTSLNTTWASGGQSYTNGGAGGSGGKTQDTAGTPNNGGFGGGGQGNSYGSGGGGGYSGGAGGPQVASEGDDPSAAGGGGSYLASDALHPTMSLGNTGNGQIIISTLSDLIVGDNASNQSTNFTSGTNAYNSIFVGSAPGNTNNGITVTSPGTVLDSYNNIIVGENGFFNYLNVSGGGRVNSNAAGVIGLNAGANSNYVAVTGITTHWSNGTSLTIGQSGSSNSLAIQEGGLVTAGGAGVALGYNVGSSGNSLLIDGAGSTLANSSDFVVGFSGSSNAVVISNGGNLTNGQHSYGGVIGLNSGAINNSVLVTGNGSAWNNGGDLLVGWGDSGNTLTVSSGGAVTSSQENYGGAIGFETGSNGNNIVVSGSGSSWSNSGDLLVGVSGSGNNMTISAGANVSSGQVNYGGVIGFDASSTNNIVLVTGTGSSWSNSGDLLVGVSGSGNNMTISAGGNVSSGQVNYGGVIGFEASSLNNSVLVTGTGSTWSNSSNLTIGDAGEGTLTIANGGSVSANSITIASQVGSTGTLNFGSLGGSDTAGGLIGPGISFGSGSGTINFNQVDSLIGSGFSGNGSLNQLGTGTTTLSGTNTYTGTTTVNSGTLVVQGQSSLGTSSVTVNGGTLVASGVFTEFPLALNAGNMTLTGAESSWNTGASTLYVGNSSLGASVVVSNGSSVTSGGWVILGNEISSSDSRVVVTGAGSSWNVNATLSVGDLGSDNSLVVSNGGVLVSSVANIGEGSNEAGAAACSNNTVLVTGTNSRWSNSGILTISHGPSSTSNSLTVAEGGSVVTGTLSIAQYEGGASGALNIGRLGTNDTAGTISAGTIYVGTGGAINFNQSDTMTMSSSIIGWNAGGVIRQQGSGTTILTGNNTSYNGATTVGGGLLLVNGSIASSAVAVQNGGTLGGSGAVGSTTIESGGTISPGNSPGNLTVEGDLVWNGGGNYNWQVLGTTNTAGFAAGTTWDLLTVTGTLDLTALSEGSKFNINLWSLASTGPDIDGNIGDFDPATSYEWLAVVASNITGFDASSFEVNYAATNGTAGFSNPLDPGYTFGVRQEGGNLYVAYEVVPEPSTYALLALGAVVVLVDLRRRRLL